MLANAVLLAALSVPTVWVVDAANGPGTNFTNLPAAIAAAQTGDVLVVRPGTYSPFFVSGKALTILGAAAPETVVVNGPTEIANVPLGTTFFLEAIAFDGTVSVGPSPTGAGLVVSGPTSVVSLANVVAKGSTASPAGEGLRVAGAEVHASRCTFQGGSAQGGNTMGGPGCVVVGGGKLAAETCLFLGGQSVLTPGFTNSGGSGLRVTSGQATIARSSLVGGSAFGALGGNVGGHGVHVETGGFARVSGTAAEVVQGGAAGPGILPAAPGRAIATFGTGAASVHGAIGLVSGAPSTPATLGLVALNQPTLPLVVSTGTVQPDGEFDATQPLTVTMNGALPGAFFAMLIHVVPGYSTPFPLFEVGEFLLLPFGFLWIAGTLDATGGMGITFVPLTDAVPFLDIPLYCQGAVFDAAAGAWRLSNRDIRILRT